MITRILASMIRIGLGLFWRIVTCSLDREVEESREEAGEAEDRPESSPSSPDENNAEKSAEFDVFLSFCGKDTRKGFIGHLYQNLRGCGIKTFIDSESLSEGERIDLMHRYVQRSEVFLPVFSKGYPDSIWCLRELSTAVKCKKKILPVFFHVRRSDLQGGDGCFARSFQEHARNKELDREEVKGWVDACKEAGFIRGYHLKNDRAGNEASLVRMIVKVVSKDLVGLKRRVQEIKGLLMRQDLEGNGVVRMIGIYGMGGIRKTTLAKAVHDEIARNFDACSFLSNVRETAKTAQGLRSLETQMIRDISRKGSCFSTETIKRLASHKKVLVVLDDVDHLDQLKALAGGCDWFGKGSCIIVTTRDKSVLIGHGIEERNMCEIDGCNMCEIDASNDDHSMELFSYHAFVINQPPDERYKQLAYDEEAGEAEERPESSSSSPEENNADENAEFELFLSFCGKDTRKSFTDNLHHSLTERTVKAFIDSENLPKGERIARLHHYVQRSKVFLPVFSKGYADSKWCLRELSTAVKCKKKIIPVFFNVEPSDLKGRGCFARSFKKHAKNKELDREEVKGWVDACKEAGSISGYHLQNDTEGWRDPEHR